MTSNKTVSELTEERGKTHGPWDLQAAKAVEIKRTLDCASSLSDSQYEALQMIAVKISRILTGDPNCADHWADIAGYATLVEKELDANSRSTTTHKQVEPIPTTASGVPILKGKVRCIIAPNGLDITVGNDYDIVKGHADPNWIFIYNDLNKVGSYRADYFAEVIQKV